MLDIHVGIRRDEVKAFTRIINKTFQHRNQVSTDSDRWEDWGKHWPEEAKDNDDIIHVIITTDIPMFTLQYLVGNVLVLLNDITDEDSGFFGRYILVTDHGKWHEHYVELCYPE